MWSCCLCVSKYLKWIPAYRNFLKYLHTTLFLIPFSFLRGANFPHLYQSRLMCIYTLCCFQFLVPGYVGQIIPPFIKLDLCETYDDIWRQIKSILPKKDFERNLGLSHLKYKLYIYMFKIQTINKTFLSCFLNYNLTELPDRFKMEHFSPKADDKGGPYRISILDIIH